MLAQAKRRVQGWLERPREHPYAQDWMQLLEGDEAELIAALKSPEARMCTLRQASPFAGALDAKTRWKVLKSPELRGREAS